MRGSWKLAMLAASIDVVHGRHQPAADTLEQLVKNVPPGQAGWSLSIDPAFDSLQAHPTFAATLALLSARAC